jgi:hypothetical protein
MFVGESSHLECQAKERCSALCGHLPPRLVLHISFVYYEVCQYVQSVQHFHSGPDGVVFPIHLVRLNLRKSEEQTVASVSSREKEDSKYLSEVIPSVSVLQIVWSGAYLLLPEPSEIAFPRLRQPLMWWLLLLL